MDEINKMIKALDRDNEKEIEEIKELQGYFQKCSNILKNVVKLLEELNKEDDEEKAEKIMKRVELKTAEFMVQMIKINQFNK